MLRFIVGGLLPPTALAAFPTFAPHNTCLTTPSAHCKYSTTFELAFIILSRGMHTFLSFEFISTFNMGTSYRDLEGSITAVVELGDIIAEEMW